MTPESKAEAALVAEALRPALEALGVEALEVVLIGPAGRRELHVGYRLRAGATTPRRELHDAASVRVPASVDYHSFRVCGLNELPLDDPELAAETSRALGGRRRAVIAIVGVAVLGAAIASPLLFGRGTLVARAGIRVAGGSSVASFAGGERLVLWATLDGSYRGSAGSKTLRKILPVHYEIDLRQNGKLLHHLAVDTQVRRPVQSLYCTIAPDCEVLLQDLPALPSGPIQLRATATPRADVTSVVDLSLNVRRPGFLH